MSTTKTVDLTTLRAAATQAETAFETTLRDLYPRADKFVWFRACEAERQGTADRWDTQMAQAPEIRAAHDAYIKALHEFYGARDGEKGFLGGRGL